jgi:hypothetical protein
VTPALRQSGRHICSHWGLLSGSSEMIVPAPESAERVQGREARRFSRRAK